MRKLLQIAVTALLILMLSDAAQAVQNEVTFTWDIPTTRENGDPLPVDSIAAYRIYSGEGEMLAELTGGTTAQHIDTIEVMAGQTVCFQITTVDTDSLESAKSDVSEAACYTGPLVGPDAPTIFRGLFIPIND